VTTYVNTSDVLLSLQDALGDVTYIVRRKEELQDAISNAWEQVIQAQRLLETLCDVVWPNDNEKLVVVNDKQAIDAIIRLQDKLEQIEDTLNYA